MATTDEHREHRRAETGEDGSGAAQARERTAQQCLHAAFVLFTSKRFRGEQERPTRRRRA